MDPTPDILVLYATAAWIGLLHTLLGPDHYLPFLAMSRAGGWSLGKTFLITVACGVGHVLGSIAIGMVGIAIGIAVLNIETIESIRGDAAGWLLLAFGAIYTVWGIRRAIRNKPHAHRHVHDDGTAHSHEHGHHGRHVHVHDAPHHRVAEDAHDLPSASSRSITPWVLFTIFIFGPCETLIPVLMYPAAQGKWWDVVFVTGIFGFTTVATMTTIVVLGFMALGTTRFPRLERYGHALAGLALLFSGAVIQAGF